MDFLNNVNTIISLVAGCIAIGTAIVSVFAKRNKVQRTLEDRSTPIEVRLRLEDHWSGGAFFARVISGIIGAGLLSVFTTIVVTFMINFFFAFQLFLNEMNTFIRVSNQAQAQDIFSHMLSTMGQIFMFSNPLSLTIGVIVGVLVGIMAGLSSGNRYMPGRIYSQYRPQYMPPTRY